MKKTHATPSKSPINAPGTLPTNSEELRSLLMDITKGHGQPRLGAKARDAFGKILDLQDSTDLLSITALSARIGTNPSTITRLAKSLGYAGFGPFQKALLAKRLQQPGSFYLNQAQSVLSNADQPIKQRAAQLCHENQANIDHFVEHFDTENFESAVKAISEARRVTVYGVRQFHSLAAFLAYGLRLIRSDVTVLDANGLGIAEEIGTMEAGDVCVVASVAPYSSQVVFAAQVAHEQGLDIVAITDHASSPLIAHATATIFVPHHSSFISNSITSFFAVSECMINAVAASNSDQTQQALMAAKT